MFGRHPDARVRPTPKEIRMSKDASSNEPLAAAEPIRLKARGDTLILGGGFAGAYVARGLGKRGATIVNPENFMLYTPVLPEAASGALEPRHVVVPLRTMCRNADLLLGRAVAIDESARVVRVESETAVFEVEYEQLVVALGAVTRLLPVPGLAEHALEFKSVTDAVQLRNHVLRQLDLADADVDRAQHHLTFVFVGGGFAGVEAVAELSVLVRQALRRYPNLQGIEPDWLLVDSGSRILPQSPERLSDYAARRLGGRGIDLRLHTRLEWLDEAAARLSDGSLIETRTVVWTAGVAANPVQAQLGLPLDRQGRVLVDELLRVVGRERLWALGDGARVPNAATGDEPDPPTCQHALRQARRLAKNLIGPAKPYRFRTLGQAATLGRHRGIAVVFGLPLQGFSGWLVGRAYHIHQLPLLSRKLRVVVDWLVALVGRRDLAALGSGQTQQPAPPDTARSTRAGVQAAQLSGHLQVLLAVEEELEGLGASQERLDRVRRAIALARLELTRAAA
jgi:NADH dehydrogenase